MSKGFENMEREQAQFNKAYGVDFDIVAFDEKLSFLENMGSTLKVNDLYRQTFIPLYQKAFANFVDRRLGSTLEVGGMIRDFERIMTPFRAKCLEEKKTPPSVFGGWTPKEYLKATYHALDAVPNDKLDYAATRYRNGDLRIRDMKEYAEELKAERNPSTERLATLYCYAEGLSSVNEERTTLWKLTNPVRYFAETRESESFRTYLSDVTGGELKENVGNTKFEEILACAKDSLIADNRRIVENAYQQADREETERQEAQKDRQQLSVFAAVMSDGKSKTAEKHREAPTVAKGYFDLT